MYSEIEFLKFIKDPEYAEAAMKDAAFLAELSSDQRYRLATDERVSKATLPYFEKNTQLWQGFNTTQLLNLAQRSSDIALFLIKDTLSEQPSYGFKTEQLKSHILGLNPKTQLNSDEWLKITDRLMDTDLSRNEVISLFNDASLSYRFLESKSEEQWLSINKNTFLLIFEAAAQDNAFFSLFKKLLKHRKLSTYLSDESFINLIRANQNTLYHIIDKELSIISLPRKLKLLDLNWATKPSDTQKAQIIASINIKALNDTDFSTVFKRLPLDKQKAMLLEELDYVVLHSLNKDWFSYLAKLSLTQGRLNEFINHTKVQDRVLNEFSNLPDVMEFFNTYHAQMSQPQKDKVVELVTKKLMQVSDKPSIEKYAQSSDAFAISLLKQENWRTMTNNPNLLLINLARNANVAKFINSNPPLVEALSTAMQTVKSDAWAKSPTSVKATPIKQNPVSSSTPISASSGSLDYDHLFKLQVIGDTGVGKSSLILRYAEDIYHDCFISTIGVDFKIKQIRTNNKNVKLQIWDSVGQERFGQMPNKWARGSHAVIVVFDTTDQLSFNNVKQWLESSERYANQNCIRVLVGTKSDLTNKRVVETSTARAYAENIGIQYYETSAKTDQGVSHVFQAIAEKLVQPRIQEEASKQEMHLTNILLSSPLGKISVPGNKPYTNDAQNLLRSCINIKTSSGINEQFKSFFESHLKGKKYNKDLSTFADALRNYALTILEQEIPGLESKDEKIACLDKALTMPLFAANWGGYWFADTRGITSLNQIEAIRKTVLASLDISKPVLK